ncbi:hypothetical protein Dimus_027709, partial [Dionaea muscipula]
MLTRKGEFVHANEGKGGVFIGLGQKDRVEELGPQGGALPDSEVQVKNQVLPVVLPGSGTLLCLKEHGENQVLRVVPLLDSEERVMNQGLPVVLPGS